MTLRPYQSAALAAVAIHEQRGARVVALVGPTGMGKTKTAVEWAFARELPQLHGIDAGLMIDRELGTAVPFRMKGVWVAHRAELLWAAEREWIQRGRDKNDCLFLTVQSYRELPLAAWYVLDECHHYYGAPEWTKRCEPARRGPTLALTATPERADGTGLGNLADAIVVAAQPRELIRDGWLVPSEVIAGKQQTRTLTEHPVAAWQKHAEGRKAIVFCRDVKHAQAVANEFRDAGIPAGCIDGSIPDDLRAARLAAHASGELTVLTTVQVLTEGYDDPSVSCAIMARGFSSAGAWIQACGRVVRPFHGKTKALVIDLRGSVYLWGLPDEDRSYSLEGKAMRIGPGDDGEAIRQCRVCQRIFRASEYKDATCPACGAMTKGKPDPRVKREAIGRVLATFTKEKKREKFAELCSLAHKKGYKPNWAVLRFKMMFGHYPGKDMR